MENYLEIDIDLEDAEAIDKPIRIDDASVTSHTFAELKPTTEYVVEIFALKENWKSDMVQLTATTGKFLRVFLHFF